MFSSSHSGNDVEEVLVEAGTSERYYWRDIWRHRELFYLLAWRDILVRYKQTVLGVAWNIIRPLVTILIFTFVFGQLARLPSSGMPYALIVFSGLIPWQFFAASFTGVSNSLVTNANLLSKVYFPRLIVPASAVVVNFVDFVISLALLIVLMLWYGTVPEAKIMFIPLFLGLELLATFGIGIWIASFNVRYRDFGYIAGFLVQIGLYISPVAFLSTLVPEQWRLIYALNPMVGVIEGFRWALLPAVTDLYLPGIMLSFCVSTISLYAGVRRFRKTERAFADVI